MRKFVWGFVGLAAATGLLMLARWPFHGGRLCLPCLDGSGHGHRCPAERNAPSTLRTFCSAQADFRGNDRDGDKKPEYWREDVAGLYGLVPVDSTEMIKLIEVSAAAADLSPVGSASLGDGGPDVVYQEHYAVHAPKSGFWFAALRFEDEVGAASDPDRFAFCAVPDSLSAGPNVFAITQDGQLWSRPARGPRDVPVAFPLEPEKAGWRRMSP